MFLSYTTFSVSLVKRWVPLKRTCSSWKVDPKKSTHISDEWMNELINIKCKSDEWMDKYKNVKEHARN